jgi:hypothetical protein
MQDEVGNLRTSAAPEALRKMSERHHAAALKHEEWQPFLLDYKGDVDSALKTHIATVKKGAKDWKGARQPIAMIRTLRLSPTMRISIGSRLRCWRLKSLTSKSL